MAGISTAIGLTDNISSVLTNINNALNMTVSAFYSVQDASGTMAEQSMFDAIQECTNAATIGLQNMREAALNVPEVDVNINTPDDWRQDIIPNEPVEIPVTWNVQSIAEVFKNSGVERLVSEMSSLNSITNDVLNSQNDINAQALAMDILPPNASWDINAVSEHVDQLGQRLESLQDIDITFLDDSTIGNLNSEIEVLRSNLNNIVNIQAAMNQAINEGDISNLNQGYTQLNNIVSQTEQRIRDNLSAIYEINNVQWDTSQNIEIFNTSGIERFKEEIQSANAIMAQMSDVQKQIQIQANNANIFPPNMINDLTHLNQRIDGIKVKIQQIQSNPLNRLGADQVNHEVESLRGNLQQMLIEQNNINSAMENMDVSAANSAYNRLNSIVDSTGSYIRDNVNEQGNFNDHLQSGINYATNLGTKIKGFIGEFLSIQSLKKGAGLISEWLGVADVGNMAEQQLKVVMQNMGATESEFDGIKAKAASLQNSTTYGADAFIGGAGELATYLQSGDAIEAMMGTLADYAAGMGGIEIDKAEMVSYATQLGKALDGQFDGLSQKGFTVTDAQKEIIEKGTEMERVAVISDIIAQSWDGLSESLANTPQGQIVQLGNAWDDIKAKVGNELYPSVMTFFGALSDNIPMIEQMLMTAAQAVAPFIEWLGTVGIPAVVDAVSWLFDAVCEVGSFVSDNWSVIEPIIWGLVAALAAYKTVSMIVTVINVAHAISEKVKAAAQAMATGATFAQTAAQYGLNAALLACPLTWIVIAIIAVIVIIAIWVNKIGGIKIAWMIVVNALMTAWDWLKIGFFTGVYWVIDLFSKMKLGFAKVGVAIADSIGDMKVNVLTTLQNMVNGAIDIINGFIDKINKLAFMNIEAVGHVTFGTNAAIANEAEKQARAAGLAVYEDEIYAGIAEREQNLQAMKDDARSATAERLAEIEAARAELNKNTEDEVIEVEVEEKPAWEVKDMASNVSEIKKSIGMSTDDLKYLRDIAERDVINRFTTAELKVEFSSSSTINSNLDIDGLVSELEDKVTETLITAAEGVHF